MLQLLIFNSISLLPWILWTVWLRHCWALISSPALQRPFRKPHYNVYSFRNMRNCLPTMASQLEQRAGGILCGKVLTQLSQHPNSAFCSRWPQNMETRGAVWTLITSSTQHTVSIRVSALAHRDNTGEGQNTWTKKKMALKNLSLDLATYSWSHTGTIKHTSGQAHGPRGFGSQGNPQWRTYTHTLWSPFSLLKRC